MAYPQTLNQPPQPASLLSDTSRLNDNLHELLSRIGKIADTLHGPEPREAAAKGGVGEPIPTVRRHIDHAFGIVDMISNEVARIEARL